MPQKQLTALEWFEYLPDEIRDKAQAECMISDWEEWDLECEAHRTQLDAGLYGRMLFMA